KPPKTIPPKTTSGTRPHGHSVAASASATTIEPESAKRTGTSGPRRSATRPSHGLIADSAAVAAIQTPPIAAAEKPRLSRASGTSTLSVPNRSACRLRLGRRGLERRHHDRDQRADAGDGRERRPDADQAPGRADHRPEQRAEDAGGHRGPHRAAAPVARRREREPGERACPGQRGAEALDETGGEQRREVARERDADA